VDQGRRTVGRYEIEREIGRGGMATVYLAQQLDLERQVALKELRGLRTLDPSFAQRFLREARLAGSFSHPNIVTVHDYFENDGVPYIAMEYLARGALRPYVGRLTPPQIGGVLEGLLAGLAHAERHEVVHRDIKPENLLITFEGRVKIADFGIAKAKHTLESNSMLTAIGTTVGTPNYIAPEQAMAGQLGPWTDLYSTGITAFELLVGRTPFGDTQEAMGIVLRQINEPVPHVIDLVPNMDPGLSGWVGWLVSKAPADRPRTAGQAWDALEEVLLRLLGPRWRREAPLLAPGDNGAAVRRPTPVTHVLVGSTPTWSERPTRPAVDPLLAATAAPRLRAADAQPAAAATPSRRLKTALTVTAAVATLFAAGALAFSSHHGGSTSAAQTLSTTAPAAKKKTTGAPKKAATTTPRKTPSVGAGATLAAQVAPARRLARIYDRSASRSSADARLAGALRRTAAAYRAAAAAASRNDIAAYTAALSAAATGRKQVSSALNASLRGGGSATTPTLPSATTHPAAPAPAPAPAPPSPCAGDSSSDDPSDDACGGA
jgi:tRNA A-37 threonylcarbamoyl transferase component Bud32